MKEAARIKAWWDFKGMSYGFARPYGGKNIKEDVATMVEMSCLDPLRLREAYYTGQDNWGEGLYQPKLSTLRNSEFITRERFDSVSRGPS